MAIIVGVDGSEQSRRALRWALEEARVRGEDLVALMAYSVPPVYSPYGDLPGAGDTQLLEATRRAAQEELAQAVEQVAAGRDLEVRTEIVEHHQPAVALTERASSEDLLVVGSRGRGGFKGLLLGSVSQQCAAHAKCPVVVVRSAD